MDIFSYKLGQKAGGGSGGGGGGGGGGSNEDWIIGDGNTHLWITLNEGRTSPMLGVCPKGTVTVDWGDGSTPDVLTGTSASTAKWTPNHEYAAAGDYVITLTVDGEVMLRGSNRGNEYAYILRYSSAADPRNSVYQNSLQKVEIGNGVKEIGGYAFQNCYKLVRIALPEGVEQIGTSAFRSCYSLASITIPNGLTTIYTYAFYECYSLASITIPNSVTSIASNAFSSCYSLASITIPNSVTGVGDSTFTYCYSLASITIPNSVKTIGKAAFTYCTGIKFYDFTSHTAVPALSATNAFSGIAADCEIRVPAALVDEWKAATNWSTYADYIVGV